MENRLKKKGLIKEVWEEDLFDSYLKEMDELVNKYPKDPNKTGLSEEKLSQLIKELDNSWMSFRRKWQHKLENAEKVFGSGKIKKGKSGMRHLIIRSELNSKDVLDLAVSNTKHIKKQ